MSNCTCGRTTRPPLCDGSHQLSEAAYQERCERLEKLNVYCTANIQNSQNIIEKTNSHSINSKN